MTKLLYAVLGLIGTLFLAALAVAAVPLLTPEDPTHWTTRAGEITRGTYTEREQSGLARPSGSASYAAPRIAGAVEHSFSTGFLPQNWVSYAPGTGDEPRPLVLLFPGTSRPAMSMIDMWQETARAEDLVLVAFDGLRGSDHAETPDAALILGVLAEAQSLYNIDPDQVFLFGHSAGAILAQVVANRVEGPWRAAAGHAGYVVPSWLHPIEDAPPVRHYLGGSDRIFSTANARIAGEQATFAGHDHELIIIPGHTHWFYEIGPVIAADSWAWFDSL